jgi:hypothetical protein
MKLHRADECAGLSAIAVEDLVLDLGGNRQRSSGQLLANRKVRP